MRRNLIPALADRYHMVAPDLPGFGFSDAPDRKGFSYAFENLARVIELDNPASEVHFYDTGPFALETHNLEIATTILEFLGRKLGTKAKSA